MYKLKPFHDPRYSRCHPQQNFQRQMTCLETTAIYKFAKSPVEIAGKLNPSNIREKSDMSYSVIPGHIEQQQNDLQICG